jgi:hypothetical protein
MPQATVSMRPADPGRTGGRGGGGQAGGGRGQSEGEGQSEASALAWSAAPFCSSRQTSRTWTEANGQEWSTRAQPREASTPPAMPPAARAPPTATATATATAVRNHPNKDSHSGTGSALRSQGQ